MDFGKKKRRHHYVWQHYLSAWATAGMIWCELNGKRFRASTENVGVQKDFYALQELTERDVQVVEKLLIEGTRPTVQQMSRTWIPFFTELHRLKRWAEGEESFGDEDRRKIDIAIQNLEEELQGMVETAAVPILNNLRAQRVESIQTDKGYGDLMLFLAMQYFRTPKMANVGAEVLDGIPGFNFSASWGLMRTILATSLGGGLFARRSDTRLTFLRPAPHHEFVTGDQPLVNTRALSLPNDIPPDEMEIYYPLGPQAAILLDAGAGANEVKELQLTDSRTDAYNTIMAEARWAQLYASTEAELREAASV